jgi:dihydroorotate dehydrogenase (NAD+) catalytic subunit
MADLTTDLGFLTLKNPVIAASGTFGYGLEFEPYIDPGKIGGFVVKGLYPEAREGNPPPRLVETASGLINAIGLQGIGIKPFAKEVLPRIRGFDTAVIVNVCGAEDGEYVSAVEFLDREEGIAAYELNISCPNVRQGGLCPALSARTTGGLVRKVRAVTRRPLIVKLSPNVTDVVEIARAAEEAGADGLSLVNTFLAMAVDVRALRPKLANVYGGLSGPAIKPIALRMVHQVVSAVEIPVIGMGGILTGEDALEFLVVGARAVEVGTASFVDPAATVRLVRERDALCDSRGIGKIRDLVGTLRLS